MIINRALALIFTMLILVASLPTSSAYGGTAELLFDAGSKAYLDGDWQSALDNWLKIEESGYQSGELFYNIGNAYYKLGDIGRTILYWERAKLLLGEDEDLNANLEIARSQLQDKLHERVSLPIWSILNNFRAHFPVHWVTLVTILLTFLLFGLMSLSRWLVKSAMMKLNLKRVRWTVTVLLLFHLSLIGIDIYENSSVRNGVMIASQVEVLSAPADGSGKMLFTLHEGAKVGILRELVDWFEISIGKDRQGWVKKTTLLEI